MRKAYPASCAFFFLSMFILWASLSHAATDGIYSLTQTAYSWDGTIGKRLQAVTADYNHAYGDEANVTYTLPWTLTFYGQPYSQINIDTNGNIWFTAAGSASSFSLPKAGRGPVISAWNNDLSSYYHSGVFVQHKTGPERIVVEWKTDTYTEEGITRPSDFEVVLYQNGEIRFDYKGFAPSAAGDFGSGISKDDNLHYLSITTAYGAVYSQAGRSYSITAAPAQYRLTVTKTGNGTVTSSPAGISCGATCSTAFAILSQVTLTAAPDAGWNFSGWSGDADCSAGIVTMNGDKACTATFVSGAPASAIRYVTWFDNTTGNNEIYMKKSSDGGLTWIGPYLVTSNSGTSLNPSVTTIGNDVYIAWQSDQYGNNEIFVKKTSDGGQTWNGPYRVTNNTGNSQNPVLTTDGSILYLAWQDDFSGSNNIYVTRSTDGALTWIGPYLLTDIGNSQNPSVITVGTVVYVAWQNDQYGNNEIFVKKTSDGGQTWNGPYRVTNNTGNSQNAVLTTDGSTLYLAWQDDLYGSNNIYVRKSSDGGLTWAGPYWITNNAGNCQNPSISTVGTDVYVAWQSDQYGNNELFVKRTTDGGQTWNGPYRVTNNTGNSQNPALTAYQGSVYLVWQDDLHGNNDIYVKKTSDGGLTWAGPYRISDNAGASMRPRIR